MSNMRLALVLVLALTAPVFAGCLEITNEPTDSTTPVKRSATPRTVAPRADGTMTGDEASEAATAQLCGTVVVPLEQTYCATQTITLRGTMKGMTELPVTLDTFVGDIDVTTAAGEDWSVVVTLEARGQSEADAIANLDNIELTWSHESKGAHHLNVLAKLKDPQSNRGEAANYEATLPAPVKYFLTCVNAVGDIQVSKLTGSQILLDTASGDVAGTELVADWVFGDSASGSIQFSQVDADEIHADSASGNLGVQGKADLVTLDSASGNSVVDVEAAVLSVDSASGSIQASFTPTADGSVYLQTASGSVSLSLPEGPDRGYSVDASTSSGSVEIGLKDGKVTSSEDEEDKHFVSTNYSQRAMKTVVEARSTSGNVDVQPK